MRLIHRNAFCRDVAIWYDEFLVPGESFGDAILDAMRGSSLFALVVTPSVTEDPNYVITTEYPEARSLGKPVLPIEARETDPGELARLYAGIGPSVPADNRAALALRLKQELRRVALMTHVGDPAHDYLVGLAYLSGIDVEVDHGRAVELITGAAEAGLMEACERLSAMYNTGDGVERDPAAAYAWCERAAEVAHDRAAAEGSPESLMSLYQALIDLKDGRFVAQRAVDPRHLAWYEEVSARLEEFVGLMQEGIDDDLFIDSSRLQKEGERKEAQGDLGGAFERYGRALGLREQMALEADTPVAWENLLKMYMMLLDPPARAIPPDVRSQWLSRMAGAARMALDRFGMLRFAMFVDFAETYLARPDLYR
jgi:TPR repeat protein